MELHRGAWRKITPQRHTQLIVFQPRKITTKTAYVYLLYALIQLNVCFINSTATVIATRGVTSGLCACRLKNKIRELVILNGLFNSNQNTLVCCRPSSTACYMMPYIPVWMSLNKHTITQYCKRSIINRTIRLWAYDKISIPVKEEFDLFRSVICKAWVMIRTDIFKYSLSLHNVVEVLYGATLQVIFIHP